MGKQEILDELKKTKMVSIGDYYRRRGEWGLLRVTSKHTRCVLKKKKYELLGYHNTFHR